MSKYTFECWVFVSLYSVRYVLCDYFRHQLHGDWLCLSICTKWLIESSLTFLRIENRNVYFLLSWIIPLCPVRSLKGYLNFLLTASETLSINYIPIKWYIVINQTKLLSSSFHYKMTHYCKGCRKALITSLDSLEKGEKKYCFQPFKGLGTVFIAKVSNTELLPTVPFRTLQSWFHNKFNMQVLKRSCVLIKMAEIFPLKTVNLVLMNVAVIL